MATVEMSFTPLPAHVRTARLVATAVARRSGVEEALLDEVRLAVGEACSRAVEAHQAQCPHEPVRIELTGGNGRFQVVVTDAAEGGDGQDGAAGQPISCPSPGSQRAGEQPLASDPGRTGGPGNQGGEPAGQEATRGQDACAHQGSGHPGENGVDNGSATPPAAGAPGAPSGEFFPAHGLGLAVIAGLADDVQFLRTPAGLSIRMSWPARG